MINFDFKFCDTKLSFFSNFTTDSTNDNLHLELNLVALSKKGKIC